MVRFTHPTLLTSGTTKNGDLRSPFAVSILNGALHAPYARIPCTTCPCTSSRGWFRWLYTIVSGAMPTEW